MKNQVIEVLNKEHGRKVIEYWKSRGVNTLGMNGSFTKENGEEERYYGGVIVTGKQIGRASCRERVSSPV